MISENRRNQMKKFIDENIQKNTHDEYEKNR